MNHQPNMPRRGLRRLMGSAITVAVIAAVLVLNVLFSFVADRFMWQVDETVTRYTSAEGVSMYTATEEFLGVVRDFAIPMVEDMNAQRAERGEDPITINIKFCTWEGFFSIFRYSTRTASGNSFCSAIAVYWIIRSLSAL